MSPVFKVCHVTVIYFASFQPVKARLVSLILIPIGAQESRAGIWVLILATNHK